MKKPAWTEKVEKGMWLIVARSPTVMEAEEGGEGMGREERDAIISAARYADYHWSQHKGWTDADVSAGPKLAHKRKNARQQATRETEGGGIADTQHPEREVQGVEEPSGSPDVVRI